MPSFGGEVKPSVPCRRFAACKRSLELRGSRILGQICRNISRPRRVPPSATRGLSSSGRPLPRLSGKWIHFTTWVYKPEAANTVRAPDDKRCAARNMLSLQWTLE